MKIDKKYEYKFISNGCVPAAMNEFLIEAPADGWRIIAYDSSYNRWLLEREIQQN